MDAYIAEIRKLESKFYGLEFTHVPRAENKYADELSKLGSTRAEIPHGVFVQDLMAPSITQEQPATDPSPAVQTSPSDLIKSPDVEKSTNDQPTAQLVHLRPVADRLIATIMPAPFEVSAPVTRSGKKTIQDAPSPAEQAANPSSDNNNPVNPKTELQENPP